MYEQTNQTTDQTEVMWMWEQIREEYIYEMVPYVEHKGETKWFSENDSCVSNGKEVRYLTKGIK